MRHRAVIFFLVSLFFVPDLKAQICVNCHKSITPKIVSDWQASKHSQNGVDCSVAFLYTKDKIRVNSIHPGFIWTPMVENYAKSQGNVEEVRKYLDSLHPIGHIGEPDDIAYGIVYLASEESKFITGSELVIDGGYTAR